MCDKGVSAGATAVMTAFPAGEPGDQLGVVHLARRAGVDGWQGRGSQALRLHPADRHLGAGLGSTVAPSL